MILPQVVNKKMTDNFSERKHTVSKILSSSVVYFSVALIAVLAIPGFMLLAIIRLIWGLADKIVRMLDKY